MFALDLDGTLVHVEPLFVRALEARLGRSLAGRDPSVYEHFGISPLIPEEERPAFLRAWEEVLRDPAVYAQAQPYPGAVEVASWLHRRGMLRGYVTSRPSVLEAVTREWLARWELPQAPLVHDGGDRLRALLRLGAQALVEDHPGHALRAAEEGYLAFLLDRPYNRGASHPALVRLAGWEALGRLLRTLPLDVRARRDPLGWPERRKEGYRG